MEGFEISCVVYEFSIWAQLHEIIIQDCLDYFPNSCNLTDVLSSPFVSISYPGLSGQTLVFLYILTYCWRMEPELQARQCQWAYSHSFAPSLDDKPKTILLEFQNVLFETSSCPVTEAPLHKDLHLLILLFTAVVRVQVVTRMCLKVLVCLRISCIFLY